MDPTEDGLKAFLKEQAQKQWDLDEQPYLLSLASPDLRPLAIDYHDIIGPERLKAFAERTAADGGYRVVAHPQQKAKVGIVPATVQFEFPAAEERHRAVNPDAHHERLNDREQIVVAFLRALSKLPDSELDGVIIPARVLAKLLGRR